MSKTVIACDLETFLIGEKYPEPYGAQGLAPIPVCLSAMQAGQSPVIHVGDRMAELVNDWMTNDRIVLVGQNLPFDLLVAVTHLGLSMDTVFDKYNKGLIRDTQIREMLIALADGEAVRNPGKKYSLEAHVKKYLKKDISADKGEDAWRMRYAELYGVPLQDWPKEAVSYPLADAKHTLQVFAHQHKLKHLFQSNELPQTRAAWDLHLISLHSPRVDPEQVDIFEAGHKEQVEIAQAPFIKKGLLKWNKNRNAKHYPKDDPRRGGWSMDTKLLKRAIQADYTRQGLVVPATPKGDISTAGDTLKGCSNKILQAYGEAATDIKMVDAFVPMLKRACENEGRRVSPRYTVILKTGRTSCVKHDTPILTQRGTIPIREVVEGDKVWTHKKRWRPVTGTHILEEQPMVTLDLSTGTRITCTYDHKLLTSEGQWITVRDLIHDGIEEVDSQPRQPGERENTIQTETTITRPIGDSAAAEHDRAQCDGSSSDPVYQGGEEDAESGQIVQDQDGRPQSHEGQDNGQASQFHRGLRRRERTLYEDTQWQKTASPPSDTGRGTGFRGAPGEMARAPHRRGRIQQRPEQFSAGNSQWAPSDTFLAAEGGQVNRCTKANPGGLHRVYDIGVEEDHSYFACGVFNHNCSGPNLQQLPQAPGARECFIPEEGHVFVSIDFSSMEVFCLAQTNYQLYGSRKLLDILNTGKDPHLTVCEAITGIGFEELKRRYEEADPEIEAYRKLAKVWSFGGGGGMGAQTFWTNMKPEQRQTLMELYPGENPLDTIARLTKQWKQGWELTKMFDTVGRKCRGGNRPDYTCPTTGRIKALNGYCQMCNAHFQGIAADAMKESMKLMTESCYREGEILNQYGVKISVEIHDEFLLSGPPEDIDVWVPEAQRLMKKGAERLLPDCEISTDAEVCGERWRKRGVSVEEYLEKLDE